MARTAEALTMGENRDSAEDHKSKRPLQSAPHKARGRICPACGGEYLPFYSICPKDRTPLDETSDPAADKNATAQKDAATRLPVEAIATSLDSNAYPTFPAASAFESPISASVDSLSLVGAAMPEGPAEASELKAALAALAESIAPEPFEDRSNPSWAKDDGTTKSSVASNPLAASHTIPGVSNAHPPRDKDLSQPAEQSPNSHAAKNDNEPPCDNETLPGLAPSEQPTRETALERPVASSDDTPTAIRGSLGLRFEGLIANARQGANHICDALTLISAEMFASCRVWLNKAFRKYVARMLRWGYRHAQPLLWVSAVAGFSLAIWIGTVGTGRPRVAEPWETARAVGPVEQVLDAGPASESEVEKVDPTAITVVERRPDIEARSKSTIMPVVLSASSKIDAIPTEDQPTNSIEDDDEPTEEVVLRTPPIRSSGANDAGADGRLQVAKNEAKAAEKPRRKRRRRARRLPRASRAAKSVDRPKKLDTEVTIDPFAQ